MLDFFFIIILLGLVLLAIELRKTYHEIPKKELKYRAIHGDMIAEKLYRAAAYDYTLDSFLWLVIIICGAASLVLINKIAPLWLGFIVIALLLWLAFTWLPRSKVSGFSTKLVVMVTPVVAWILNYYHPIARRVSIWTKSGNKKQTHTRVYDKKGLNELIEKQKKQDDNRIAEQELEIIKRSMKLSETKVSEVCLPWSKVVTVSSNDSIGPVLLDELHKSGQDLIPVTDAEEPEKLVGVLNLNKLDIGNTGLVSKAMESPVYYINEQDDLSMALKTFATINTSLFVVTDDKEDLIGMLKFDHIIEELVGHIPGDDFEQYSSIDFVASKYKQKVEPEIDPEDEENQ
ncbi:MAG TPA: CBS domain-containing protein [Candidatus Saccharimonadales bacterium]